MTIERMFLLVVFLIVGMIANSIELRKLGIDFSKSNVTNYDLLREAHLKAIENGDGISYEGIDTIKLEIPKNCRPIPLPKTIDFSHTAFVVRNTSQNCYLFEFAQIAKSVDVDKKVLESGKLIECNRFDNEKILLIIKDENPWVVERKGYASPHIRKDLLLIEDGRGLNELIQPYNMDYSYPVFSYVQTAEDSVVIKNLSFIRTENSTYKTFCIKVKNSNNIFLSDLTLLTPESELYGDAILTFENCSNLNLDNIYVNRTYSQIDRYGYAVMMNNVYNCHFKNIYADGKWGVFGTNNVNTVHIEDCNINRFDIHCYGRDVYCKRTLFRDLYNQFSSFYGELYFDRCKFQHFIPVTIDGSFSAYTFFDVTLNHCDVIPDPKRPYIFNMTHAKFLIDSIRPELEDMMWPNLFMENVNIVCNDSYNTFYLYHVYRNSQVRLDKKPIVRFDDVWFDGKNLKLSNAELSYPKLQ